MILIGILLAYSNMNFEQQTTKNQEHFTLLPSTSSTSTSTKRDQIRLIWHRRDLRLHDNELYHFDDHQLNQQQQQYHDEDAGDDSIRDLDASPKIVSSSSTSASTSGTTSISLFIFDPHYFNPQPSCTEHRGKQKEKNNRTTGINTRTRTKPDTTNTSTSTSTSTIWCGPHAAQSLVEAVANLRISIRAIGGELLIRSGDPTIIVPQIAQELGATEIVYSEEPGTYECRVALKIQQLYQLQSQSNVRIVSHVGCTLYHPNDLPFDSRQWDQLAHPKNKHKSKKKNGKHSQTNGGSDVNNLDPLWQNRQNNDLVNVSPERFKGMCRIMGDFRKAARGAATVRNILEPPKKLVRPPNFDSLGTRIELGSIPTLEQLFQVFLSNSKETVLGIDRDTIDFVFKAARDKRTLDCDSQNSGCGEAAALQRIEVFLAEGLAARADRSLADVSKNNSSRLSKHFALGTLSPRMVYWRAHEAGEGAEWLMSHLEMRDFFIYTCFAAGDGFYQRKGLPVSKKQVGIQWYSPKDKDTQELWKRWATGKTQLPLVDAAMIELMTTGYCSNRVRQNLASVLTKDLGIDWRAGAEWFQFLLEDHCVGANFGNWLYFSGVGPDPKNRHFRTVSQAKRYDRDGEFVKRWLPDLNRSNDEEVAFRPWDFGIVGYESPIVDPESQYTWQDLQGLKENGSLLLPCKELE